MTTQTGISLVATLLLLCSINISAQQVADTDFQPPIASPAYQTGRGPLVLIDEAHFNFHTATGRYTAFASLLRRDGYVVRGSAEKFSAQTLRGARVLVIANALNERNQQDWSLPTPPAFTAEEVSAVKEWVGQGGALLLIADHMPFPGAAENLAAAFGIRFSNGFARRIPQGNGPDAFSRSNRSLAEHQITNGRTTDERIDTVVSFTGSAFTVPNGAEPLMLLDETWESLEPDTAWQFDDKTRKVSLRGWLQGAVLRVGKGRVAVFGEAAMFSAQLTGPQRRPMGMNAPVAKQNPQFLLNVMHWLTGILAGKS